MRRLGDALVIYTNRHGGVSSPPFESLNLGRFTDDDPEAVRVNWGRVVDVLRDRGVGLPAGVNGIAWVHQVHGSDVHVVGPGDLPGPGPTVEADALVTTEVGLPLGVPGADCALVALATTAAVAAVHAGWKGLAAGVMKAAVDRLRDVSAPADGVRAVLGPCIHAGSYEFDDAALDDLVARLGPSVRGATRDGAPAFDLPAAVRSELARAGVTDLDDVGVCTASSPDHFSHRRDAPTGRQAMLVTRFR
ncbi:MAG: polyphenol oxidase family protein [Acidimicrobiia bacterium]